MTRPALGIEIVYQDLALADNLDIVQNMFLGREQHQGHRARREQHGEGRAETLASLSVRTVKSVRQRVSSLSGGQRQTVAIAKAVLWNSKVVILDEPTAALGVAQTAQVLDLVRRLADRGLAVVLISHNMNDVLQVADRIAVLYLGPHGRAAYSAATSTSRQLVELITTGRSEQLGLAAARTSDGVSHRPPVEPDTPTAADAPRPGSRPGRRWRATAPSRAALADYYRNYIGSGSAAATWVRCPPWLA